METIETKPNRMDAELFSVMEQAVKDEPAVRTARRKAADIKTEIITEMCIKDKRYKEALDEYRRQVNAAYIERKETAGGTPVIRRDTESKGENEESIQARTQDV